MWYSHNFPVEDFYKTMQSKQFLRASCTNYTEIKYS